MPKEPKHDVDDDPMFDTSKEAVNRAHNRRIVQFLDRVDNVEEEIKGLQDDRKDIYAEAKAVGYDTKMMREVRKLRKMKKEDRDEYDTVLALYREEAGI